MPLQALLVELYEKEGGEAGLEEAAQVLHSWRDGGGGCGSMMNQAVPFSLPCSTPPPTIRHHAHTITKQICETLGTELDPIRVRYWLGAVQARIHRRLVADLGSPSASASASASTV